MQLEGTVQDLQLQVNDLQVQVNGLQLQLSQQSNLVIMYDLICLFEYYFITPHFSTLGYSSWNQLLERYADIKAMIDDGECDSSELNNFKDPINAILPQSVDVELLIETSRQRHDLAHSDLRSARKQNDFVTACGTIDFREHHELATKLLLSLRTVQFRRKK